MKVKGRLEGSGGFFEQIEIEIFQEIKMDKDTGLSKSVVLIGLSGTGKSSIGVRLAKRLNTSFVDMDVLIEQRVGQSISSFFEKYGEAAFRDLEQEVLFELLEQNHGVIATGGGVIVREPSRKVMKEKGIVVYLSTSIEELYERLLNDDTRPMLKGADLKERLRVLGEQRNDLYKACAHHKIESCYQSMDVIVDQVISKLNINAA